MHWLHLLRVDLTEPEQRSTLNLHWVPSCSHVQPYNASQTVRKKGLRIGVWLCPTGGAPTLGPGNENPQGPAPYVGHLHWDPCPGLGCRRQQVDVYFL